MAQQVKNAPAMQETQERWVLSLGQEDPLEKEMATHSSMLTWKIPWAEEPGGLLSKGLQRVGHDWVPMHIYITEWIEVEKSLLPGRSFGQPVWSSDSSSWWILPFSCDPHERRFTDSSVDKETTCNAGGPSSISGLGRCTEEGISYLRNILGRPCWLSW